MLSVPGRKRGYYRAVKRNDPWAMAIEAKKLHGPLAFAMAFYFRRVDWVEMLSKPSFISTLPKQESLVGGFMPVPFKMGKDK